MFHDDPFESEKRDVITCRGGVKWLNTQGRLERDFEMNLLVAQRRSRVSIDPQRARELALALPEAHEAPHFHRTAFRTPRKIFATLDASAKDLNLMFDPEQRDFFCEQVPDAFAPVPGGWGRKGATRCDLTSVDEQTLQSALLAAHALAGPKPKRR